LSATLIYVAASATSTSDVIGVSMLIKSFSYLTVACAVIAALTGANLALDSVQFLIEKFRMVATIAILMASGGLLVASVLLVRWPIGGRFIAVACVILAMSFVVGGISHMGNVAIGEAVAQASCTPGATLCFPQVANFVYALTALGIVLLASNAASWLVSRRHD